DGHRTCQSIPFKLFFERLRMWYRLYDGADETVGPLVAGRLQGRAQKIALGLRLVVPMGNYDVGDAALVKISVDEWNLKLEEAIMHSGLEMGNVAKTYLYFRASQLPHKHIDDIMLQLRGDMGRFEEARLLALRLAHRQGDQTSYYDITSEDEVTQNENYWNQDDNSWNYADWTGGDWNDEWLESYYDEDLDWYEADYDDSWYTDEGIYQDTVNQDNPEGDPYEQPSQESEGYFKGKRKGLMGL
ncbi:unnamed protein product, partial [Effrenium voratum]